MALKSALSAKVADAQLILIDEFAFTAPKTKEMIKVLENLKTQKKALIVLGSKDENVAKSARNLPGVMTTYVNTLNVYDILNHDNLIMTKEALEHIEEVYAG